MGNILSESSTRIKTGLALMSVFLIMGYIDNLYLTWFILGLVMFFAVKESMDLFGIQDDRMEIVALATWFLALYYPQPQDIIFVVGVVFASYLAYTKNLDKKLFLPLLYPLAPMLFLFALYTNYGIEYLLWLVIVVSGADIGAYFVGKSIGKTSFCATSPNKTLEGVMGGLFVAAIAGTIIAPASIDMIFAFAISFVAACASVFGDLFESYLKREANVKDSGDILPGHGGMLDRSDGFLFAGIIMYIALNFVSLI